ncbi:hypothetical protein [Aureivirga sp. CE67]|uniref:hypothetical protein n=1 Tax=Aureivirga sp. CE67 TaxID=1788983 RepID=UPI0018CB915D|nr:hypothetical protein [Aureivirga sp. CE67]
MDKINVFLKRFFKAEVDAKISSWFNNIENYNIKLKKMNSFLIEDLKESFGMVYLSEPKDDEFYNDVKYSSLPTNPRHLFKISHYKNEKYGDLYLAYVSNTNADEYTLHYSLCFFITEIDGHLKIIKEYFRSLNEYDYTYDWAEGVGIEYVTFETAGEFISCERYLEPNGCEFSMKDYLTNK